MSQGVYRYKLDFWRDRVTFSDRIKKLHIFRQTGIRFVCGVALLLVLVCLFFIIKPNKEYEYEGGAVFENSGVPQSSVVYEKVALPPGVYYVELAYETDVNLEGLCTIQDSSVFTGGLLTNGEHLYSGLTSTGFHMWLLESTDHLEVSVNFSGKGNLTTGKLAITETNQLWTLLLTVILFIACVVLALMIYRLYDRSYSVDLTRAAVEKKNVFFGLAVIVLFASLPNLLGSNINGADLVYHLQRIEGVKDGLLSGQFPVRLEPEWVHGHGYANAIFYCNTLLFFPAVLRLLGFTVTAAYNIYCIAINAATALIAYVSFGRIFKDRYMGLLCSGLYTLSIFRIYKFIITGALGEGSAVTFIPLVLYGFYRAVTEDSDSKEYRTVWVPIAFGYAGLIQTHVLTCEITAFVTIIACIVLWRRIFRRKTFLALAKGALGAVFMSLWYLVPFLQYYMTEDIHIRHVTGRTIQDRGLYPAQLAFQYWKLGSNALTGEAGMQDSHALGVGLVLTAGFLVFSALWFGGSFRDRRQKLVILGKISFVFSGMLMLMSLNVFPWDKIQFLNGFTASLVSSLQFPNRFLGWGTAFLIVVTASCLWYFQKYGSKWQYYLGLTLILAGMVTSSLYLIDYVCRDQSKYRLYNEESMGFGYISGEEYLIEGTDAEKLYYRDPVVSEGVALLSYEKKYLTARLGMTNLSDREGYVDLPLLYYTGYQAKVEETGERLSVTGGDNHVVRVSLPAGFEGTVKVGFVSPVHWRLSEVVSYLFLSGLAVTAIYRRRKLSGRAV